MTSCRGFGEGDPEVSVLLDRRPTGPQRHQQHHECEEEQREVAGCPGGGAAGLQGLEGRDVHHADQVLEGGQEVEQGDQDRYLIAPIR